jgi:hypothetical protein
VNHLGWDYDVGRILDLARFFFPWSFTLAIQPLSAQ